MKVNSREFDQNFKIQKNDYDIEINTYKLNKFNKSYTKLDNQNKYKNSDIIKKDGMSVLSELSMYFKNKKANLSKQIDKAIDTKDPHEMMKIAIIMGNSSTESDIMAKIVGKSVSSIDQLTKLS